MANRRQLRRRLLGGVLCALSSVAMAAPASGRMTVLYDVAASMQAMIGVQPDGTPGLGLEDGIYQQVTLGPLPPQRHLGALTGGIGSASTPTIRDLPGPLIAALVREEVDSVGAGMAFIDIGPEYDIAGPDGQNLDAAMTELAATAHPAGGNYAQRVHMYISRLGSISDPSTREAFWHAMSLTGGIWLEAYQGRVQWSPEYWLAWPRALRDGLIARGMSPDRLHIIIRGSDQAATWANFRVGVACELLANGPGAYRIEDQPGFVREFRATFGTAPAPAGSSTIGCSPAPTLPADRARVLADVIALEPSGAALSRSALSSPLMRTGRTSTLIIRLGEDPLGIAQRLGVAPATFWAQANATVRATGPGVDVTAPVAADGSARLLVRPTAHGALGMTLTVGGASIRSAIGPPVDLALSLAPHRARLGGVLGRMIDQPVDWHLAIPLRSTLRAGPPPPRLTVRMRLRRALPARSIVELRMSRPASRLLVEVGVIRKGRFVMVRRLRMSGTRLVIPVRVPARTPVAGRVVIE